MGNILSYENNLKLVNFEYLIEKNNCILINTLDINNQECLIYNTISYDKEEEIINNLLNNNINKDIVIYGKNSSDYSTFKKFEQLKNLGFKDIKIYSGGLFEWLILQDIYGDDTFITTSKINDFLKYK